MADTVTDYAHLTNGSQPSPTPNRKGIKRPNSRFVGASSADLADGKLGYGVETSPTKWGDLPINATFSKSKSGLPLCVKISSSSFVEVFGNRRESRIGGGEVYKVHQR